MTHHVRNSTQFRLTFFVGTRCFFNSFNNSSRGNFTRLIPFRSGCHDSYSIFTRLLWSSRRGALYRGKMGIETCSLSFKFQTLDKVRDHRLSLAFLPFSATRNFIARKDPLLLPSLIFNPSVITEPITDRSQRISSIETQRLKAN